LIIFRTIKYKNILSTGNSWTEIVLNNDKSTLIVGENGAGKSTMLDALTFALYGKPFRKINKAQLLNSINQKDLRVEASFSVSGNNYIVKRSIKPNTFEIWKNDILLNQDAAARDYQQYLEENILKMNLKSFAQVVVLGASTFVPFMQLKAGERRGVIEDLLDIGIFSTMNNLLKDKVSSNKEQILNIKYQIDLLDQKIESAKTHNESIRVLREGEVTKLKSKLKEQIAIVESERAYVQDVITEVSYLTTTMSDKKDVKAKLVELQKLDGKLSNKVTKLHKDIHFYDSHDDCPTCRQSLDSNFKKVVVKENEDKVEEISKAKTELYAKIHNHEERLKEIEVLEDEIAEKNISMSEHNAKCNVAMSVCKDIKRELTEAEHEVKSVDTGAILELEKKLLSHHEDQTQLFDDKDMLSVVSSMLRDGGIKTRIIKQYVPVMNKLINKYLAAMEFFVDFQLDENFNETIKSRFRDEFSYASFSEGEKLRIDLALLFTWRAVSKLRNSVSTNLLIMDEIMDSSLDSAGTEEFLRILNELTVDTNVFIISHKGDSINDKFDKVLRFTKHKNFSQLAA
jgi:DNA repair exonuclease SbcCD ATPase subunit